MVEAPLAGAGLLGFDALDQSVVIGVEKEVVDWDASLLETGFELVVEVCRWDPICF
ncbi:hypothetical protein ABZ746_25085 [Streptomyces sp. NPDC020096]